MTDPLSPHERELIDWIVEQGYPFDWGSAWPFPEHYRDGLVDSWMRKTGARGEQREAWRRSLIKERAWDEEELA